MSDPDFANRTGAGFIITRAEERTGATLYWSPFHGARGWSAELPSEPILFARARDAKLIAAAFMLGPVSIRPLSIP